MNNEIISYIELRMWNQISYHPRSYEWMHIMEAWKILDFNEIWTRDLVIPVLHSNQMNYEATAVDSWPVVRSNEPANRRRQKRVT